MMYGVPGMIAQRLMQLVPVMIVATFVVFSLVYMMPGDPAMMIAGDYATAERIAEIRQIYGFDRPMLVQYFFWLGNAVQGDLGHSLFSNESVLRLILSRLPHTILLVLYSLVLGAAIGVPLGILAATRQGTTLDKTITSVASLGVAVPNFWLGIILVTLFSLGYRWFPATGAVSIFEKPLEALYYATLPAIALSTGVVAVLARQVRSALLEVLGSQYIRTLRAKGLGSGAILWKHGLRNVAATMLTIAGLQVNRLFSSAVIIEAVFAIPGVGNLISYSALNKDFPVVQGVALVLVLVVILTNLLVDVLNATFDPRVAAST
ncbi:peptide/nickel transport system permease protein [Neorhizobium galegae]|uniref:ABC transporter permease n=1 Tax=Neorhizobium galegae TaxID=399 RepID=UPI001AE6525E|nr:ABC transporter permease [Neorhizobium galegae]MBP2559288.1 peptide/nickel transport system permease protein [Neorhizobium galegae]MDQ0135138.1 peptide/nickel transport system permease protein [Neorhizobium galegae]